MPISATLRQADEVLAERTRREIERLKAEDAEHMRAERERVRNDSFKRHESGARYATVSQLLASAFPRR